MCCGRSVAKIVTQQPNNPLPALSPTTPITDPIILLRYIGTTAVADLANPPSRASYRLRKDKTISVFAQDVPYYMAKVDGANAAVFERLS